MSDVRVIHDDCLDVLPTLEAGSVDVVITSPPYNIGNVHHRDGRKHRPYADDLPEPEYQAQQVEVLDQLYRVADHCFYNHKNRIVSGRHISPLVWLLKTKWIVRQECVWINGGPNHDPCRFFPKTERIYWLAKSYDARLSNRRHWDVFDWKTMNAPLDGKGHTRAFPLAFPMTVLEVLPDAQVVLDPYAGSGTTGVAAMKAGRRCILIEKNPRYIPIIERRLKEAETPLFTGLEAS